MFNAVAGMNSSVPFRGGASAIKDLHGCRDNSFADISPPSPYLGGRYAGAWLDAFTSFGLPKVPTVDE